ncbi:MAG TPA: lamin tail domain-containing protein [Verrucomicrobiae bacterium]|nr:lamin tail domain-containing protein [Verrucomicrobiae bacterium]
MSSPFCSRFFSLLFGALLIFAINSVAQEAPRITEFMASNSRTLADEDGDSSDWIEIYNPAADTVSLDGWFLTDDANRLAKWRFPNVTLEGNGYMVVFASGKNRTNDLNRLHTGFQLSAQGEFLALVDPQTNIVSAFAPSYPPQQPDVAYGRDLLSPEMVGYFPTPTPGAPNNVAGTNFGAEVRFSVESGTFLDPFDLRLTTTDPTAEIHYLFVQGPTASGRTNVPTISSPLYTGPLRIIGSAQVRARAFKPGVLPGPPHTETYFSLDPSALSFSSDLPIMVINNLGQGPIPPSGDQSAAVAVFERDQSTGRATLVGRPTLTSRAAINIRGRGTQDYPKSSLALEFWDEFNVDKPLELLGMPAESDWVLYGPVDTEPVLIHNPLAREMSNIIGRYGSRTRFLEVFLQTTGGSIIYHNPTNGHYNGIYVAIEKIKRGPHRVNVTSLDPADTAPDTITGGYMFKSDEPIEPDEYAFLGARQQNIMVYPGKRSIVQPQRAPQLAYLRSYFGAFSNALFGLNWTNPVTGYAQYADVNSFVDHLLISAITYNVDAIRLSGYFFKERNRPLEMGPIWDCDRSLGSTDGRQFNPRLWSVDGGTDYFNPPGPGPSHFWFGQMSRDINFWQRFIDRYQEIRKGPYTVTNLYAIIDRMVSELQEAQPREQAKWGFRAPPRGVNGTGIGTYATEVIWLKTWLSNRLDFMDTNFLAQPRFNVESGPVPSGYNLELTAQGPLSGTQIYYQLDGSDPRLLDGGISPTASLYSGPIPITRNTRVLARAYNPNHRNVTGHNAPPLSSPWSGTNVGIFVVQTPPLIITEIMYHPDNPPAGDLTDPDHFEYIELKNIGATTLDLVGFHFTNGIDFTFTATNAVTSLAPGARVVLVKDRLAFRARYPDVTNVAGEFRGNLANDGNRLTLVGPVDELILDFRYEDHWFPITDGSGFSLVMNDENGPLTSWGDPARWRPSSWYQGSPGADDPPPTQLAPIVISEVLAHSVPPDVDAIELCNPTAQPVNLGGWFLTDDPGHPKKFRIPANTMIGAGACLHFTEAQFNLPGDPNAFALSRLGDEVHLFSGDGTNLTGYTHGFDFGPSDPEVSFGRHVTSTGDEEFVAQAALTFGSANAGPRVGPVVLRTILYDPRARVFGTTRVDNLHDQFIELYNTGDVAVPLYDVQYPTHTWKISGGIDFNFPSGVVLPAHGSLLVVAFEPGADVYESEAFRIESGYDVAVPLYGPFTRRLGREDDVIDLRKPGLPVLPPAPDAGLVPYVRVEKVAYSAQAPWPTNLSGSGMALRRSRLDGYANDPANWSALRDLRPTFDQSPTRQTARPGGTALFTVAVRGTVNWSYQWRYNGVPIPDATNATLAITNVQLANAGRYDLLVLSAAGTMLSPPATLTVLVEPTIVQQPVAVITARGVDVAFQVSVTNTATLPITYRWMRGFTPVSMAQLDSYSGLLSISQVQPGHAGSYSVQLSNAAAAPGTGLVSRVAPLIVVTPPSNVVAQAGADATLRASVGTGANNPASFQWLHNDVPIRGAGGVLAPGTTNMIFTVTNVHAADEGFYSLWVTNSLGTAAPFRAGIGLLAPVTLSDPSVLPDGAFQVWLQGIGYQTYQVQFTTNFQSWSDLLTVNYTTDFVPIVDPTATNSSRRAYRVLTKP